MSIFSNEINSAIIPKKVLYTGSEIPVVGLGTFGSDSVSHEQVAEMVKNAVKAGYRHIDCASVYGNEKQIGLVLKELFQEGVVKREDIWITSKVWNDMHDKVAEACKQSLTDLQLDYLDLYLLHWPFPNYHAPGCDVSSRNENSKPYIHDSYMETWNAMESLVDQGLVKNIGTSNMTIPKMKMLLRDCMIRPACNEMELHPHFQQPELFDFCVNNYIQPIGYCPIGSPGRPERDRTADDTVDLEDQVIIEIAKKHNVHAATICIKWAIQRGQIPIPFSCNHFIDNLQAALMEDLSDEEMAAITKIDKDCRLIKGQVFLWKENQSWEDLWDVNGEITPA